MIGELERAEGKISERGVDGLVHCFGGFLFGFTVRDCDAHIGETLEGGVLRLVNLQKNLSRR